MDNRASHVLSDRDALLSGDSLNNLSAEAGHEIVYQEAEYRCEWFSDNCNVTPLKLKDSPKYGKWYQSTNTYGISALPTKNGFEYIGVPYILGGLKRVYS